jgi:hypothetical protein
MGYNPNKNEENVYPHAFEQLKEMDEKLGWVDELPDEELEKELNEISEKLTKLLVKLKVKVEQQDKQKFQKWVDSNK